MSYLPPRSLLSILKLLRDAIRTTMNIYGNVVTDEMTTAGIIVAQLAFH